MFLRSAIFAIALLVSHAAMAQVVDTPSITLALEKAKVLKPLRTVVVAHRGKIVAEHGYRGYTSKDPTAIKQITTVFREGAGYDPERLLKTIRGLIGVR